MATQVSNILNRIFETEGNEGFIMAKFICFFAAVIILLLVVLTRKAKLMYLFAVAMAFWFIILPLLQAQVFPSQESGGVYYMIHTDRETACGLTLMLWIMFALIGIKRTGYREMDAGAFVGMLIPTIPTIACIGKSIKAEIYTGLFKAVLIAAVISWARFLFFPERKES